MNHIKILLLVLLGILLVNGMASSRESDSFPSDSLFTLAILAYIWHMWRRRRADSQPFSPLPEAPQPPTPNPEIKRPVPPVPQPVAPVLRAFTSGRVIHHKAPWTIVEKGKSVGTFHHLPIPAWIRTSDNRQADYAGIAQTPPPAECVCVELLDQAELILPPGLIYVIRS
ncbi:MAG: hypothetical protein HQL96_03205 [Magnetococcales bacterium]|nr:hypothetical protein [Magnetococcales bacterium]